MYIIKNIEMVGILHINIGVHTATLFIYYSSKIHFEQERAQKKFTKRNNIY
jgi:hypothetical protein